MFHRIIPPQIQSLFTAGWFHAFSKFFYITGAKRRQDRHFRKGYAQMKHGQLSQLPPAAWGFSLTPEAQRRNKSLTRVRRRIEDFALCGGGFKALPDAAGILNHASF